MTLNYLNEWIIIPDWFEIDIGLIFVDVLDCSGIMTWSIDIYESSLNSDHYSYNDN